MDNARVARNYVAKYTKTGKNMPNDFKIYQMTSKYTKWPKTV
jgi:hypothetical protein